MFCFFNCLLVVGVFFNYVQSENQDPIIEKLHADITEIQNVAHGEAFHINTQLLNELNQIYLTLLHERGHLIQNIDTESEKIIKKSGQDGEGPKIGACLKTRDLGKDQLIFETIGAVSLCRALTETQKNYENIPIGAIFEKQQLEHLNLENDKKICANLENQEKCLLDRLLDIRAPSVRNLAQETGQVLQKFKYNMQLIQDNYKHCMNLTEVEILQNGAQNVLYLFGECVNK